MAIPKRLRYRPRVTEAFPFLAPLNEIPGIRAGWIERVSGLTVTGDRDAAMNQLRPAHEAAVARFSRSGQSDSWWRAEQVHGNAVAVVPGCPTILAPDGLPVVPGVDGLVTANVGTVLSIYVADCGAIWLADRKTGAIGLLHSGKKGTESNILNQGLQLMAVRFGTRPEDVIAVLGPCIRPPDYEVDFASEIDRQAVAANVGNFIDCQLNTASNPARFYSYRKELGKTGRMMALLVRDSPP